MMHNIWQVTQKFKSHYINNLYIKEGKIIGICGNVNAIIFFPAVYLSTSTLIELRRSENKKYTRIRDVQHRFFGAEHRLSGDDDGSNCWDNTTEEFMFQSAPENYTRRNWATNRIRMILELRSRTLNLPPSLFISLVPVLVARFDKGTSLWDGEFLLGSTWPRQTRTIGSPSMLKFNVQALDRTAHSGLIAFSSTISPQTSYWRYCLSLIFIFHRY